MKLDKSRVYTAINAEELKIGSTCIFANSIKEIKDSLQTRFFNVAALTEIRDEGYCARFITHSTSLNQDMDYAYAYLIEPPKEPEYKPFSSMEKAMEAIQKHGGWIRNKEKDEICLVTGVTNSDFGIIVYLAGYSGINSTKLIHERFSFFDDGTPCGELAEE